MNLHDRSKRTTRDEEGRAVDPSDARGRNSYDFIRFCAASSVLFSHHFDLAGLAEPQVPGFHEDFGQLGVEVFFCLSGFLICRSLQRSVDWRIFAAARIMRIFPNLIFVLVTTSILTLLWYRNDAHLWSHVTYVVDNLAMFARGVTFMIPGIFADATRSTVNEPLWTLPYELWLYVALFLIFVVCRGRTRAGVVLAALLFTTLWSATSALDDFPVGPFDLLDFVRLGSYFLSGAVLGLLWPHLRSHAPVIGITGLIGIFVLRNLLPFDTILQSLALACATIGLGSSRAMAWFSRGGDASYGMYVFAWPVQQFSLLLIGSFWLSMLAAFLVTVAIGYATWHGFEKQALSYPKRLAEWRRSQRHNQAEIDAKVL